MIPVLSDTAPAAVRVLIATRPVDFRRGADGLAATVQSVLRQDPFSGTIFVFRSKRADRVKMLVYDGGWGGLYHGPMLNPAPSASAVTGPNPCNPASAARAGKRHRHRE